MGVASRWAEQMRAPVHAFRIAARFTATALKYHVFTRPQSAEGIEVYENNGLISQQDYGVHDIIKKEKAPFITGTKRRNTWSVAATVRKAHRKVLLRVLPGELSIYLAFQEAGAIAAAGKTAK